MTGALAAQIAYHAALGLVLAAVVWLVGAGCLALLRRPLDPRSLLDAYPLGLFVVMAAVVPALLWSPLGVLVVLALALLLALGVRRAPLAAVGSRLACALLGAAGFGVGLGIVLHGPTEELDSAAYGGMLWYVAKVVSAVDSIAPFRDPLAEGEQMIYAEAGTSFVGAAISWLPGFDAILYHAATLPAFAVASLCIGLALFVADRQLPGAVAAAACALIAVAVVPYASWITETPPAAFAVPLAFSLWRVWRDELEARWIVVLSAIVALDYFQTKVLGIMALGLVLVGALVERNRRRPDFARLAAIGAALLTVGAAVVVGLLFAFASWYAGLAEPKALPWDALRGLTDGDVDRHSVALALLVAGEVVLVAALARAREWTLAVALGVTVLLSWFVAGYGFDIALQTEIFLAALLLAAGARVDPRMAVAAGSLLALSIALRDVLGLRAGATLALFLFAAFAAIVFPRPVRVVAPALGAAALLAAFGGIDREAAVAVTTADRDIWSAVHARVPEDGLVFTSLTGREVTPHRGWNNYPAVADRQLYVAGWYDGRLVSHPEDRDRKLAENRAVLTGAVRPEAVDLSRTYGSYYAVTERDEPVLGTFRRLYANDAYVLYAIP